MVINISVLVSDVCEILPYSGVSSDGEYGGTFTTLRYNDRNLRISSVRITSLASQIRNFEKMHRRFDQLWCILLHNVLSRKCICISIASSVFLEFCKSTTTLHCQQKKDNIHTLFDSDKWGKWKTKKVLHTRTLFLFSLEVLPTFLSIFASPYALLSANTTWGSSLCLQRKNYN